MIQITQEEYDELKSYKDKNEKIHRYIERLLEIQLTSVNYDIKKYNLAALSCAKKFHEEEIHRIEELLK